MLIKHSAFYLLGRIIPGSVGLLALTIYTRILTADQYGQYALLVAAIAIVNAVFFQWLNLSLGRLLPARTEQPQALLSVAFFAFLTLMVITAALGGIGALCLTSRISPQTFILVIVVGWAQAWFDLNLKIINVNLAPIRYGLLTSLKALLALCIGIALLNVGLGIVGILLGLMIGLLLTTIPALKYWREISMQNRDKKLLKTLIVYGAPLTFTFMLTLLLDVADRFMLGWYLNVKAVGAYAAAYDLTQQSLGMLLGVIHLAAFPITIRALEEKGVAKATEQIRNNAIVLLGVAIPATVGLALLAENISAVMLGEEFRDGANYVIIIIAISVFVAGIRSFYFDYSFQLARKMRGQLLTVMWAVLANIGLNLWWIPKYGVVGAAYATFVACLVGLYASWYLGRKAFKLPPFPKDIYKVVLAAFLMGATLLPTLNWRGPIALACQIALGGVVYVILVFVFDVGRLRQELVRYCNGAIKNRQQKKIET